VGVLEAGDVLSEQSAALWVGWFGDLRAVRGGLLETGAGSLEGALHRRDRGVEHGGDLGGGERENLPQDQYGALSRRKGLQRGETRAAVRQQFLPERFGTTSKRVTIGTAEIGRVDLG